MQPIHPPQHRIPSFEEPGPRRLPLKRTFSAPQLGQLAQAPTEEKLECAQRHGKMWDCVGRRPNRLGGYIYHFKLRTAFDINSSSRLVKAKIEQLRNDYLTKEQRHAAFEELSALKSTHRSRLAQGQDQLRKMFPAVEKRKAVDLRLLYGDPFTDLGYALIVEDEGTQIYLPDKDALELNWERLRQEADKKLPPLHIMELVHAATDLEFIEAHLTHDAVLSKLEFVHDHLLHIVPALHHLFHHPYARGALVKRFAQGYRTLLSMDSAGFKEKRARIQAAFSAYIDIATSEPVTALSKPETHLREFMINIWPPGTNWSRYFYKRFPKELWQDSHLKNVWKELLWIEKAKDYVLNQSRKALPLAEMDQTFFAREGQKMVVTDIHGAHECFIIYEHSQFTLLPRYHVQGEDCGMTMQAQLEVLEVGPFAGLAFHPHMIDIACQFARIHHLSFLKLHRGPTEWQPFFELGFRIDDPHESLNEALLIAYARGKDLLTPSDELLLAKIQHDDQGLSEEDLTQVEMILDETSFVNWCRLADSSAVSPIVQLGSALLKEDLKALRLRLAELKSVSSCQLL